jgi:radical SAM superfamily enzyme YgiQ (UPF0313 family)
MTKKLPKILLTTYYIEPGGWYEYFSHNKPSRFQMVYHVKHSHALSCIKQNIPGIEILQFPTWEEYEKKLSQGWDIVGFSFYSAQTQRVARMAKAARDAGVKELWGGNYGITTPGALGLFDKVFPGYAEHDIADYLGVKIDRLRHPPIIDTWYIRPLPFRVQRVGQMQSQRGCPMKCTFCQTPRWAPRSTPIPLESVDETLRYFKEHGVDWVGIHDESFGLLEDHSREVVKLLKKYRLFWTTQTRVETATKFLDEWCDAYLMGFGVGIENVDPQTLKDWHKNLSPQALLDLADEVHRKNRYIFGYYILGNANATYESTIAEIEAVTRYDIDYIWMTILTPFPDTPLWEEIDNKYGIFEKDWDKFDTKHLTWNHPHIKPGQMEKLLDFACESVGSTKRLSKFIWRIYKSYSKHLGSYAKGLALISSFPYKSYRYHQKEPYFFPPLSGQKDLETGSRRPKEDL